MTPKLMTIAVDETRRVSGILQHPRGARACYVLAHGAGAGMTHPFITAIADGLTERGIATLRYQFPYMEQGGKRPDAPKLAQATVRAAVAEAARLMPKLAAHCRRQILRRPHDLASASRNPSGACAVSLFSDFRCTQRAVPRRSARHISSRCRSPCCSCKGPAMRSPTSR